MSQDCVCDYLVVGGGSAGCVIARRLAERTSGRIILLEAGPSDEGDDIATDLSRLDEQGDRYDWGFRAATLPGSGPVLNYARARMLGGCANHNDCAFIEPAPSDLDRWEQLGASGWGASAMRRYRDRVLERTHVDRYTTSSNRVSRAFVAACRELGLSEVDFTEQVAAGTGYFPLNAKGALRQSSSIAYLHPLSALPKHLEVWTETFAERLTIEDGRATGAITSRGPVRARRHVILTCGAIQTPQLMMVSGLGPAHHLREHGIPVVVDLPGVGQHLLDHVASAVVWDLNEPVGRWELTPFEAVAMLKVDADAPAPDVLYHFGLRVREKYAGPPRLGEPTHGIKASPNVTRARSEGAVRLASADPRAKPVIELRYLSDPEGYDQRILLAGMRFARCIGETDVMRKLIRAEVSPGPAVQSDDEWIGYMRSVCETVYHASGTCVMGDPSERRVVVGPDLRVKGIAGLSVCDASVFPAMVTTNINFTVMMLAEKAADCILP